MNHNLKLKQQRIANNKTVTEIADYLAMSECNYRKIEKGEIKICIENVLKLSRLYKMDLNVLLEIDNSERPKTENLNSDTNEVINFLNNYQVFSKLLQRDEELICELKSEVSLLKGLIKEFEKENAQLKKENYTFRNSAFSTSKKVRH